MTRTASIGADDDGWEVERLFSSHGQVLYAHAETGLAFLADVGDLAMDPYLSKADMGLPDPLEDASWSGPVKH